MKKLLFLFLLISQVAFSQNVWTVKSVPNTRLQSDYIHVSDPDGYLSDSAERVINQSLNAIRDQADVFVVTLRSIGKVVPKQFANELFNYWGIGDAETNNGVLLLFVEDQHAMEFETGYGMESVLTDAQCQRIFEKSMKPLFQRGDYEGGLLEGVIQIINVIGVDIPDGLMSYAENRTFTEQADGDGKEEKVPVGKALLLMLALVVIVDGLLLGGQSGVSKETLEILDYHRPELKDYDGVFYYKMDAELKKVKVITKTPFMKKLGLMVYTLLLPAAEFFMLFVLLSRSALGPTAVMVLAVSLVVGLITLRTFIAISNNKKVLEEADKVAKRVPYSKELYSSILANRLWATKMSTPWVEWYFRREYLRRINAESAHCPKCGCNAHPDKSVKLTDIQRKERELRIMAFDRYRCDGGHRFVVGLPDMNYSDYKVCNDCGARTLKEVKWKNLVAADYSHSGEAELTYQCRYCGVSFVKKVVTSKREREYENSGGGSDGGSSSGGGSFGGGGSGGGGYSGRW